MAVATLKKRFEHRRTPKTRAGGTSPPLTVTPERRDLQFDLPAERISNWFPLGESASIFLNTLSIFFPEGERFFIASIRHYRDNGAISDPELQKAVRAFIGQEATHGREHEDYNALSVAAGFPIDELEGRVSALLDRLLDTLPPSMALSATTALEHWTAVLGGFLLEHPEVMNKAEPTFRDMWMWHAVEETEHKGVAFDVFREVVGSDAKAEAIRMLGLVVATIVFWSLVADFHLRMMRAHAASQRGRAGKRGGLLRRIARGTKNGVALFRFTLGDQPGFMRRAAPLILDYFRPGFHPWDHDNRHHLALAEELAARHTA